MVFAVKREVSLFVLGTRSTILGLIERNHVCSIINHGSTMDEQILRFASSYFVYVFCRNDRWTDSWQGHHRIQVAGDGCPRIEQLRMFELDTRNRIEI